MNKKSLKIFKRIGFVFGCIMSVLLISFILLGLFAGTDLKLILITKWLFIVINFITVIFLIAANEFFKSRSEAKRPKPLIAALWIGILLNMSSLADSLVQLYYGNF